MKAVTLALVATVFLASANAWVALEPHDPNNVSKNSHCHSSKVGAMKSLETKRIPDQCAQATCRENRDVFIEGCGVMVVKPPCYISDGDLSKPYPDCCYEIKCLDNNKRNKA